MRFIRKVMVSILATGIALSSAAVTIFALNDAGILHLHSNTLREYEAKFYSEGALVWESGKVKKGTKLGYGHGDLPTKRRTADGKIYQCIGWDISGEGIPDPVPHRIYTNFTADAVFMRLPTLEKLLMSPELMAKLAQVLQNLNIHLSPEQVQNILNWLNNLGIDWESIDMSVLEQLLGILGMDLQEFMDATGLDFESAMSLLAVPMFKYTATYSGSYYFRTQSYGNAYVDNNWTLSDYYSKDHISIGSLNPLAYATDKIIASNAVQASTFNFTYLNKGDAYPVPNNEIGNNQNLDSDSYSLVSPTEITPLEGYKYSATYETRGLEYVPADPYVVTLLKTISFSNDAIKNDEVNYRNYARDHYMNVPDQYRNLFNGIISENKIAKDDNGNYIRQIMEYFVTNGYTCDPMMNAYPKGEDKILYFMTQAKEGLGSHFADASTMFFRTLGVPARTVSGYVDQSSYDGEEREVSALQSHEWTEIYIDDVGWLTFDAAIACASGEYSEYLTNNDEPIDQEFGNDNVTDFQVVDAPTSYFVGDEASPSDFTFEITYENGTTHQVSGSEVDYMSPIDTSVAGPQTVTAYIVNGTDVLMATTTVNVEDIHPVSISVDPSTMPSSWMTGVDYNVQPSGTVTMNNGTQVPLDEFDYTISSVDTSSEGTTQVTISLDGYPVSTTQNVQVADATGIHINENAVQQEYLPNNEFTVDSYNGQPIGYIELSNGETMPIYSYNFSSLVDVSADTSTPGTYSAEFSVPGHPEAGTTTVDYTVITEPHTSLQNLDIGDPDIEVQMNSPISSIISQMSPTANYDGNVSRPVDESTGDFEFHNIDFSTPGNYYGSVSYTENGVTVTTPIHVEVKSRSELRLVTKAGYSVEKQYDGTPFNTNEIFEIDPNSFNAERDDQYVNFIGKYIRPDANTGADAGTQFDVVYIFEIRSRDTDENITSEYVTTAGFKMYFNDEVVKAEDMSISEDHSYISMVVHFNISKYEFYVTSNELNWAANTVIPNSARYLVFDEPSIVNNYTVTWSPQVYGVDQFENNIVLSSLVLYDKDGNDITRFCEVHFEAKMITYIEE